MRLLFFSLTLLTFTPGHLKAKRKKISEVLENLSWGAGSQKLLLQIKEKIDTRYEERIEKAGGALQVDRILREKRRAFAAVKQTHTRFVGQQTGYESSIISDDFETNNGESVIQVDEGGEQRYYFFKDDLLWKILIAYSARMSRSKPFPQLLKEKQKIYGRYKRSESYPPSADKEGIRAAIWEDEKSLMRLEDRSAFYDVYVAIFVDKKERVALEQSHKKEAGNEEPDAEMDSLMNDILGGNIEDDQNESVVDQLTGVQHKVDFETGRPVYEELKREKPVPSKKPKKRGKRRSKKRQVKKKKTIPENDKIIY